MFKNFYSITFLVIFSLFFSACQNSSPVGIVPDPAGGGFPGDTLPSDGGNSSSGTGVAYGDLNDCVNPFYGSLTPFRNPLTNPSISADSSGLGDYPGLTGLANAYFPEIGDVILVSTTDGVLVFDSIGRPIARPLNFDDDCFFQGGNFIWPPENDGTFLDLVGDPHGVLNGAGYFAASVWGGLGGYRLTSRSAIPGGDQNDEYSFNCELEEGDSGIVGPRDFWLMGNELVEFSGTTLYDSQGTPFQINGLSGGPGQLGVEWDAYGNLWQRTVGQPIWPNFAEATCEDSTDDNPDTRGSDPAALLIGWTRGEGLEGQGPGYTPNDNTTCPYESNAGDGFGTNPGDCRMHVFTGPGSAPAAWSIPTNFGVGRMVDFDFTSDNRMVYVGNVGLGPGVCITQPVPDLLDAHNSTPYVPPSPPEQQYCIGGFGSNTGGDNVHFLQPWGISIDKQVFPNEIYVSDFGNGRVTVLDTNLNFLRTINQAHSPQASIEGPMDVSFDFFCRIFVLDKRVGGDPELLVLFRENCPVPGNGSAEVVIRDSGTGVAIENASIVLGMFAGNVTGTTDSEGRLTFPTVPPGIRSITVSAPGYHSAAVEFSVTSGETTIIEDAFGAGFVGISQIGDATTGALTGIVRDSVTNLPIANAVVLVRSTGQIDVTDNVGLFRIDNIIPGFKEIDISASGYMGTTETIIVEAGRTIDMGDVPLDPNPST
tara:strand:+ start:1588 stop:3711 length:2124 start_codon:yes stop_codon:yes gene_type:complete